MPELQRKIMLIRMCCFSISFHHVSYYLKFSHAIRCTIHGNTEALKYWILGPFIQYLLCWTQYKEQTEHFTSRSDYRTIQERVLQNLTCKHRTGARTSLYWRSKWNIKSKPNQSKNLQTHYVRMPSLSSHLSLGSYIISVQGWLEENTSH